MNNRGFTLIEVLAVIVILSLVGMIAVPSVLNTLNNSKVATDKVLYDNIGTGLKTMYEEIYFNSSLIYSYDNDGKTDNKVSIVNNQISTNIQTLVSNGFLSGANNSKKCIDEDSICENKNTKIVLNSNGDDIGNCEVRIEKTKTNTSTIYKFFGSDKNNCPTDSDLEG